MKLYEFIIILFLFAVFFFLFMCNKKPVINEVIVPQVRSVFRKEPVPEPEPKPQFPQLFPLSKCNECVDYCKAVSPIGCDGSAFCTYNNRVQCLKDCNDKPSKFIMSCNGKPFDSVAPSCEEATKQYCETLAAGTSDSPETFMLTYVSCLNDAKKNPGKFAIYGCM
jgi:hypothetical protein